MTEHRSRAPGDALVDRLLLGANGDAANDLLNEIHDGYPVDRVAELLASPEQNAVKAGVWIASELGSSEIARFKSMLPDLLDHDLEYVRFFALDLVLYSTTAEDGALIAKAAQLVQDRSQAVRFKSVDVLSALPDEKLRALTAQLEGTGLAELVAWLGSEGASDESAVADRLNSEDPAVRRLALAAALRLAYRGDFDSLQSAARSGDAELSREAARKLSYLAGRQME